jgi:phosphoglycolate phosphatase
VSPAPVRAVIFDLDGTLVQTRAASWEIFARISERYGLGVDEPQQYFDLFRGNIYESIAKLCRDEAQAAQVKDAFLDLLRTEYTPPLVPGVTEVVRRLASDCTLAVMSSNAMQVLRRVLVDNDLAFCFAHVFGGDVTPDKSTAMRSFLADAGSAYGRRCSADYDESGRRGEADPGSTVLVTDTAGDVREALAEGIRAVGVAWGMHSVEELTAAGAEFVALWPQEISAHLLGDAAALPPDGACAVPAIHRPAGASAPPPARDCGCDATTCPALRLQGGPPQDDVRRAGDVRRRRRRDAALVRAGHAVPQVAGSPSPADAELLAALRRVCAGG